MSVTSKSQNLEGIFISTLLYKYHICIVVFHQTTKLVFLSAEKKNHRYASLGIDSVFRERNKVFWHL